MLHIITTLFQRQASDVGIKELRTLAINASGDLKRMDRSPKEADEVAAICGYLTKKLDEFEKDDPEPRTLAIEPAGARVWKTAMVAWTRKAVRQDKQSSTGSLLITDIGTKQNAVQKLVDQLNDQLNLPTRELGDIVAEEAAQRARKKAPAKGKPPETTRADDDVIDVTGTEPVLRRTVGGQVEEWVLAHDDPRIQAALDVLPEGAVVPWLDGRKGHDTDPEGTTDAGIDYYEDVAHLEIDPEATVYDAPPRAADVTGLRSDAEAEARTEELLDEEEDGEGIPATPIGEVIGSIGRVTKPPKPKKRRAK